MATKNHIFREAMAVIANIVANTNVNIEYQLCSCRDFTEKLEIARPTRKPPQYSVDSKACIPLCLRKRK